MAVLMGRRRTLNHDLPPGMHRRHGRYYYGRNDIALGPDLPAALRKWAELAGGDPGPGTFADAVRLYQREMLASKAPKTQQEYARQLVTLTKVFGAMALDRIKPSHVAEYLARRPAVAGTREKALLSSVFNVARARDLTVASNPCAGIKGVTSRRARYVTDDEFAAVLEHADPMLRGFLELCYRTGQRPADVLRMTRADVQDGALRVVQGKTGATVRLRVAGPLAAVLESLKAGPIASLWLVHEAGARLTLGGMRKRFLLACAAAGVRFQIRDLRAKYATDMEDAIKARRGLGHRHQSTTDAYLRDRIGELAEPAMREIAGSTPAIAGKTGAA